MVQRKENQELKKKPINPTEMRKLAIKLMDHFNSKSIDYWDGMIILVDNEMWMANKSNKYECEEMTTKHGTKYYVVKNIDISAQNEYSNPETITLLFDGSHLYHRINYAPGGIDYTSQLDEKFLKPYGLYFELGHAWSMAAYQV